MSNDLISRDALVEKLLLEKAEPTQRGISTAIAATLDQPYVDAEPVRHGRWILKVHDERINYRWSVTAYCSECCDEENEIWAGFFPCTPGCIAHDIALDSAKTIKLSNYCPNCGAKMDGGMEK